MASARSAAASARSAAAAAPTERQAFSCHVDEHTLGTMDLPTTDRRMRVQVFGYSRRGFDPEHGTDLSGRQQSARIGRDGARRCRMEDWQ